MSTASPPADLRPAGDRQLELLRWVAERGPVTVGEAADGFGAERGLARTTVQTMLDRLAAKGQLSRRKSGGVYRYASTRPAGELLRELVRSFVEGPLAGTLSPFVAYLAERQELDAAELADLERIVERLERRREEEEERGER